MYQHQRALLLSLELWRWYPLTVWDEKERNPMPGPPVPRGAKSLRCASKGFLFVVLAGTLSAFSCASSRGKVEETWETSKNSFRLRVTAYAEENGGFVAGRYYVFQSAQSGSNAWHEIMTFRHDDPIPIPRDQVRFVNDRIAYVFMGWMYAISTNGGQSWSIWNALTDLPNWKCCNYGLIQDIRIDSGGGGTMTLNPIRKREGEVPILCTKDFGRHWTSTCT